MIPISKYEYLNIILQLLSPIVLFAFLSIKGKMKQPSIGTYVTIINTAFLAIKIAGVSVTKFFVKLVLFFKVSPHFKYLFSKSLILLYL